MILINLLSIIYYKIQYWSEPTVGLDNGKLKVILFKVTNKPNN